jgi:hypothetical protein
MISRFLRDQAWWRLDCAGASALRVARSVVSLLDAAAYVAQVPDDHPDLRALALAGCFRGGVFDPGQEGLAVVRGWQLADQPTAGPRELLAAIADAASGRRMAVAGDYYHALSA